MHVKRVLSTVVGILLLSLALTAIATAQTDEDMAPDPQTIELPAADELTLVGDYYALPDVQAPTVLLLHELNADRSNWTPFVEPLWAAGYNLLIVDLRGHGESGDEQDWEAAVGDIRTWFDWLREQPEVQTSGISIIGAGLGGNLAVIACENDPVCLTAIAISPVAMGCENRDCSEELAGVDEAEATYLDEMTVQAVTESPRRSPVLLLSSSSDDISMASLRQIGRSRSDRVELAVSTVGGHGTALLGATGGDPLANAIQWLDARTPVNLTATAIETLVAAGDPGNGERLFTEGNIDVPFEEGQACIRCHVVDSEEAGDWGPGLWNVGERAVTHVEGQSAAVYLYNSVVAPDSYVVDGFNGGSMPWRYDQGFIAEEIADLVAYMLTLEP